MDIKPHEHGEIVSGHHKGRIHFSEREMIQLPENLPPQVPTSLAHTQIEMNTLVRLYTYQKVHVWRRGTPNSYYWEIVE